MWRRRRREVLSAPATFPDSARVNESVVVEHRDELVRALARLTTRQRTSRRAALPGRTQRARGRGRPRRQRRRGQVPGLPRPQPPAQHTWAPWTTARAGHDEPADDRHDDLWVRRLQDRADEVTPDVPATPGIVVRRGRRRRTARRASAIGGTARARPRDRAGCRSRDAAPHRGRQPAVQPEDREVVIDTTTAPSPCRWTGTSSPNPNRPRCSTPARWRCTSAPRIAGTSSPTRCPCLSSIRDVPTPSRGRPAVRGVVDALRGEVGLRHRGRCQRQRLRGRRRRSCSTDRRAAGHRQRVRPDTHRSAVLAGHRAGDHTPDFVGLALESTAGLGCARTSGTPASSPTGCTATSWPAAGTSPTGSAIPGARPTSTANPSARTAPSSMPSARRTSVW